MKQNSRRFFVMSMAVVSVSIFGCRSLPEHRDRGAAVVERHMDLSAEELQRFSQLKSVKVGPIPEDMPLDFVHCVAFLNSRAEGAGLPAQCRVRIDSDPQALVARKLTLTLDEMYSKPNYYTLNSGLLDELGFSDVKRIREMSARLDLFQWLYFISVSYGAFYDFDQRKLLYLLPDVYTGRLAPNLRSARGAPLGSALDGMLHKSPN